MQKSLSTKIRLAPAQPTKIFDTFWNFAVERQNIFFRRLENDFQTEWTDDPILAKYKFTNAYRASDRVTQYLIKNILYSGDKSVEEIFFKTILFKLFNRIETWELLENSLGSISYLNYSFREYDRVLSVALDNKQKIYSAAYIMPSGKSFFGHSYKHRNQLKLLEKMMEDEVPNKLGDTPSMKKAFEILRSYPSIGDFLAYQYVTDLNYSEILDFSEMEFVVPGPGALSGLKKCFSSFGGYTPSNLIRLITDQQEEEFDRRGLSFKTLWGRRLQLIDCQNLFCEVDKYTRVANPEISEKNGRSRIKQYFRPNHKKIVFWYPPKWDINGKIENHERL